MLEFFFRFHADTCQCPRWHVAARRGKAHFFEFFENLLGTPWKCVLESPYRRANGIEKKCSANFSNFVPDTCRGLPACPVSRAMDVSIWAWPVGGSPDKLYYPLRLPRNETRFFNEETGGGGRFREFPQKLLLVGRPSVKHSWLVQALQETTGQGSMVLRNTLNL